MNSAYSRIYTGETDLMSILELLRASRPAEWIADYPSPADLRELLSLRRVQANTRLWFGELGLVGCALVDHFNNLLIEFLPGSLKPDIERQIGEWAAECMRASAQPGDGRPMLDASCRGEDLERIAQLQRLGFEVQSIETLHFTRPLDIEIPEPQLPEGFTIRAALGEIELEALVALHRAAFGTQNMTIEERRAMMHTPDYDPEMDLVAVSPEGELAAYCFCTLNREENLRSGRNEGSTDPVAVHPNFHRRGLARALLISGMRLLKRAGAERAVLGTSSENIHMQRAAEAVGFRVEHRMLWFSKTDFD